MTRYLEKKAHAPMDMCPLGPSAIITKGGIP